MNIGSLSRTGEIFNISTLIVPDMKFLEEEDFKSLSMSSENWLRFEAVGEADLPKWL